MEVSENNTCIDALCNDCGSVHPTYSGEISDGESVFAEYLISLDPNDAAHFILGIKINGDDGYISCALNVNLKEMAVHSYIDEYPLIIEGFNWIYEIQPRSIVLENGIDNHVLKILETWLMKDDSRINSIYKQWTLR